MIRSVALLFFLLITTSVVRAEDAACRWSVVVADQATASMLPELPWGSKLSVLMPKKSESDAAIHSRARRLTSATHFIYCGSTGVEPTILSMYRERFRNQGAVVVDVRSLPRKKLIALFSQPKPSAVRLVVTHSLTSLQRLAD
ncbi:MAG: hypothetical protein AAGG48_25575 [Planctomycetota bacterium]